MKRKISIAIAFVGNPEFILLDEPTTGLDPFARQDLWNWMQTLTANRTVLLTTHYMDEAEILSDRIIILHNGEIKSEGSSSELKSFYNCGYTVTVEKSFSSVSSDRFVLDFLSMFPTATITIQTPTKILFNIPRQKNESMLPIVDFLKEIQQKNIIIHFDLSFSNLDDVFYRAVADERKNDLLNPVEDYVEEEMPMEAILKDNQFIKNKTFLQIQALLLKRLFRLLSISTFFVEVLFALTLFLFIYGLSTFYTNFSVLPPLSMDRVALINGEDFPSGQQDVIPVGVKSFLGYNNYLPKETPLWKKNIFVNFSTVPSDLAKIYPLRHTSNYSDIFYNYSLNLVDYSRKHLNSKFVGSYLFYSPRDHSGEAIMYLKPPSDVCIFANRTSMHSLPVHIQPLLDAAIKDKGLASYQSKIRNVPLSLPSYLTAFVITVTGMEALIIMFLIAPFPLLLWVTTEKKLQLKHLQFLSGVHPTTYWIINFLFDFILLLGILSLGVALYSWFSISYTTAYFTSSLYLMAALSALSLPWFAYAICYASDDYSKNQLVYSLVLIYCIILSVASFMIHFFGTSSTFNNLLSLTHWMGGLLPLYNISAFLIHLTFLLFTKSPLIDVTVDPLRSYILWICVDTLFYALLVISIDIWKIYISKLKNLRMGETSPFQGANNAANMSDVLLQGDALQAHAERSMEEAAAYQPRGESLGETLTVNNISKIYSKPCSRTPNIALQNTYFQMHPGTITSLVGPNGAGKSTLLNVLSGILEPSKGLVFLGKNALHLNPFRYLKSIVSCPQSNALWEELSPMEHLQLFAMMHGCRTAGLRIQLMQQFRHMGMERYANVRVKTLSGGTQRKLSVLISLLEPRLLCLMDEPTTGLDPIARKKFSYYIVAWLRCSRLPPINIISTHAVEEVEEISDRLMVVMKGNILFEGTIRQLKERYKWMRRLVVKFTSPTPEEKMYYKKKLGLENKQYLVFKELIHLMDEDMDKTPDLIYPYDRNCLEKAWEMLLADENRSTTVDQFLDWWCLFIKSHNLMTLLRKVLPYEIKQKNSQSLFFEFVITSTTDVDTYNIFRIFEDGKFLSDNHVKEYFFSCARLHDYVRIISDEDNE